MTEPTNSVVPDGAEVVSFVHRLGGPGRAWVSGVGFVEGAEVAVARGNDEESVAVPGRVTLVSLAGPRQGPHMVVLARAAADGVKVFAGRLVKARAAGVFLTLREWAELPELTPSVEAELPQGPSRVVANEDDDEADELPKFGDQIDHFVFGLCDVMVVRGERLKLREVHGAGKLREIHVGPFKLLKPVVMDGKRVFKLLKRN